MYEFIRLAIVGSIGFGVGGLVAAWYLGRDWK